VTLKERGIRAERDRRAGGASRRRFKIGGSFGVSLDVHERDIARLRELARSISSRGEST
jgi:hypothetical protein